jgi:hypothetical protein
MYHPAKLYELLHSYYNPLDFSRGSTDYKALLEQYRADMALSENAVPKKSDDSTVIYMLPNLPWAKRVVGVMRNDLAKKYPNRAHALLIDMGDENYRVSVRAPYSKKVWCRRPVSPV